MEKLKLHSPDFTQANIAKLAELFPNCVTEIEDELGRMKDEKGGANSSLSLQPSSLRYAIDFDLLKQELSTSIVEGPQERYQLNWPGKREALLTANAPIAKTLRPCRLESVDFDTTQNLYIEGDNLDALKLLQETYLGKVKMIYIDPPYNTGNDFIYEDDFAENTEAYFERSNQKDEVGNRLVANNESNGRFHSDWLSMMYSRLKLARNLLKDDGVIFISIDEGEQANLKRLCDEIFGEDNFINCLIWKKRYNAAKEKHLAAIHEYIIIFAKNYNYISDFLVQGDKAYFDKYFKEEDEYIKSRGRFMTQPLEAGNSMDVRPNLRFPIISPDGSHILPRRQWIWGKDKVELAINEGRIKFYKDTNDQWKVRHKQYEKSDYGLFRKVKPFSIYDKSFTQDGTKDSEKLFSNSAVFSFPKPVKIINAFN